VLIAGYATATQCAAYGVVDRWLWPHGVAQPNLENFCEGLMGTTRTSCMIMFILAGAAF
jgi:TRAP-type mannitol/chloroaromatic compound transport system permease large subunit